MADQRHDERMIRRGLAVLVDDAPIAPEFDDLTTTRVRPVEIRGRSPYLAAGLSAATVLVALVALGAVLFGQSSEPFDANGPNTGAETQTTLAGLAPGEVPYVLLDAPAWSVIHADHWAGETGQGTYVWLLIVFSDGAAEADLSMSSGLHPDPGLNARVDVALSLGSRIADEPIWGTTATVVAGTPRGFVAVWESNAVVYEFIVGDTEEEAFRSLMSSLTQVTEDGWVAAHADSDEIVTDRPLAISNYLEDVPLPPKFDVSSLEDGPMESWYQVAAETVAAVSCAWIDYWIDGKESGDVQAEQSAVDAMVSSHNWQVLIDMKTEGDYSEHVWEYADAMASDGMVRVGDGEFAPLETYYENAFGCSN